MMYYVIGKVSTGPLIAAVYSFSATSVKALRAKFVFLIYRTPRNPTLNSLVNSCFPKCLLIAFRRKVYVTCVNEVNKYLT